MSSLAKFNERNRHLWLWYTNNNNMMVPASFNTSTININGFGMKTAIIQHLKHRWLYFCLLHYCLCTTSTDCLDVLVVFHRSYISVLSLVLDLTFFPNQRVRLLKHFGETKWMQTTTHAPLSEVSKRFEVLSLYARSKSCRAILAMNGRSKYSGSVISLFHTVPLLNED